MRISFPLAAVLAAGLAGLAPFSASAQVSVDLHALDKLPTSQPGAPDAGPSTAPSHARHADQRRKATHASRTQPHAHKPASAANQSKPATPAVAAHPAPPPPQAKLPTVAPPPVVLAPTPPPPVAAAPPPPLAAPPAAPEAGGDALPTADGLRVTFPPSRFDLSPETSEALQHFAAMVPKSDNYTLDVRAYAAAVPDDPSAARRLSLSRSLAIRAALMADGFPSTRIFLRALGAGAGGGPADRCDIMISRLGAEAPPPGHAAEHTAQAAAPAPPPPAAAAVPAP
jgi:outer membrane protein OmpA-like peptidoglycan-associated protein